MMQNIWKIYYQKLDKKKSALKIFLKIVGYLFMLDTMYTVQQFSNTGGIIIKTIVLFYYLCVCLYVDLPKIYREVLYLFSTEKKKLRQDFVLYKLSAVVVLLGFSWIIFPWSIPIDCFLVLLSLWIAGIRSELQKK